MESPLSWPSLLALEIDNFRHHYCPLKKIAPCIVLCVFPNPHWRISRTSFFAGAMPFGVFRLNPEWCDDHRSATYHSWKQSNFYPTWLSTKKIFQLPFWKQCSISMCMPVVWFLCVTNISGLQLTALGRLPLTCNLSHPSLILIPAAPILLPSMPIIAMNGSLPSFPLSGWTHWEWASPSNPLRHLQS